MERTAGAVGGLTGGVLATAGNAPLLNQTPVGQTLQTAGTGLQNSGLAGLPVVGAPVGAVVQTADNTLNPLGKVVVLDQPILGSGAEASTQLVGLSALSPTQTQGQLATVGVLSSGSSPTGALGQTASGGDLLNVSIGETTLLGGEGSALVGASVLSQNQPQGALATAGVLPGGSSAIGSPLAPVTGVVGGVTGALGGGSSSGVLAPVTGIVGGVTGAVGGLVGGLSN